LDFVESVLDFKPAGSEELFKLPSVVFHLRVAQDRPKWINLSQFFPSRSKRLKAHGQLSVTVVVICENQEAAADVLI